MTQMMSMVDSFLQEVGGLEKRANYEPGSQGGETSHVSKNIDDRTQEATEGEQSADNTKRVKADIGEPSVDSTSEASASAGSTAKQDSVMPNIGTTQAATGEDSATETSSVKATKDDGQYDGSSSHPARTDNSELDGQKYASLDENSPLEKVGSAMKELGDNLCRSLLAYAQGEEKTAAAAPAAPAAKPAATTEKAAGLTPEAAAEAGFYLGNFINGGQFDKQAADEEIRYQLGETVKCAHEDADHTADYFDGLRIALTKQAEEEGGEPEKASPPSEGGEDKGSSSPEPKSEGGAPPSGGDGGGAPAPAAGGAPAPGGGGISVEEVTQLLNDLGITTDELGALLQGVAGGGAGAGAPPMGGDPLGGGAPPMPPMGGGDPLGGGAPPAPPMGGGDPLGGGAPPMPMEVAANVKSAATTKQAEISAIVRELVTARRRLAR